MVLLCNTVMEKPFTVILFLLKFSVKSEKVKFETKLKDDDKAFARLIVLQKFRQIKNNIYYLFEVTARRTQTSDKLSTT